jgi:hypothetical protein
MLGAYATEAQWGPKPERTSSKFFPPTPSARPTLALRRRRRVETRADRRCGCAITWPIHQRRLRRARRGRLAASPVPQAAGRRSRRGAGVRERGAGGAEEVAAFARRQNLTAVAERKGHRLEARSAGSLGMHLHSKAARPDSESIPAAVQNAPLIFAFESAAAFTLCQRQNYRCGERRWMTSRV